MVILLSEFVCTWDKLSELYEGTSFEIYLVTHWDIGHKFECSYDFLVYNGLLDDIIISVKIQSIFVTAWCKWLRIFFLFSLMSCLLIKGLSLFVSIISFSELIWRLAWYPAYNLMGFLMKDPSELCEGHTGVLVKIVYK